MYSIGGMMKWLSSRPNDYKTNKPERRYGMYRWKDGGCNMENLKPWPDITLFIGSNITSHFLSFQTVDITDAIFTCHFCLPYLSAMVSDITIIAFIRETEHLQPAAVIAMQCL